jgi:hypothetical protein
MHTEPDCHTKVALELEAILASISLPSPDHRPFVFRLARDWASPSHGRDPDAHQILYRIIRPDNIANPGR